MSEHISNDWADLQEHAMGAAANYAKAAIKNTEDLPEGVDRTSVIIAMITASAAEFSASAMVVASQNIAAAIVTHSEAFSEGSVHISNSLDTIAEAMSN